MIGKLSGIIEDKSTDGLLLNVSGVGYDVTVPLGTLAQSPPIGTSGELWIHTHVREDDLRLFGFATKQDRTAFRTMLKISGVGPKLALAVIGGMTGEQLARVIHDGDAKRLSAIPGIGKKTAERIILELGGKLKLDVADQRPARNGTLAELASALKNLGFKPNQVEQALAKLEKESAGQPFDTLLRQALAILQKA